MHYILRIFSFLLLLSQPLAASLNKEASCTKTYSPPIFEPVGLNRLEECVFQDIVEGRIDSIKKISSDKQFNINLKIHHVSAQERPTTFLEQAIIHDRIEIAMHFVSHKNIDVMREAEYGQTYLHLICNKKIEKIRDNISIEDYVPLVRALIDKEKKLLNIKNLFGYGALSRACGTGHVALVKTLLSYEEIEADYNGYQERPISVACAYFHPNVVALLLDCDGVNPNKIDKIWDEMPLYEAIRFFIDGYIEHDYDWEYPKIKPPKRVINKDAMASRLKKIIELFLQCPRYDLQGSQIMKLIFEEFVTGGEDFFPIVLKNAPGMINNFDGCGDTLLRKACAWFYSNEIVTKTQTEALKKILSFPNIKPMLRRKTSCTKLFRDLLMTTPPSLEALKMLVEHKNTNQYHLLNSGIEPPVMTIFYTITSRYNRRRPNCLAEVKKILTYLLSHECTEIDFICREMTHRRYQAMKSISSDIACIREMQNMIKDRASSHYGKKLSLLCTGYLRQSGNQRIPLRAISLLIASYLHGIVEGILKERPDALF